MGRQLEEVKAQFAEVQSEVEKQRAQLHEAVTLVLVLRAEIQHLTATHQNVVTSALVTTPPTEPSAPPLLDLEAIAAVPDIPLEMEAHLEETKVPTDDDINLTPKTEEVEEGLASAPTSTEVTTTTTGLSGAIPSSLPQEPSDKTLFAPSELRDRKQLGVKFHVHQDTIRKWHESGTLLSQHGWEYVSGGKNRKDKFLYRYNPQAIANKRRDTPDV